MATVSDRIAARPLPRPKRERGADPLDLYPGLLRSLRIALANSRKAGRLARSSQPNPEDRMR